MAGERFPRWLAALLLNMIILTKAASAANTKSGKAQVQAMLEAKDKSGVESPIKQIQFETEKDLKEDYHATINAYLDRHEREMAQHSQRKQSQERTQAKSGLLERLIGSSKENHCGVNESSRTVARENLVVLPAGDSFDASKWMNDPRRSNWDIIIIYYGKNKSFTCSLCKAVYRASGPKWRLAWGFTLLPEWEQYRKQYSAIMFPDDDLVLDVCTINTVFAIMKAYKLLMAQPSLCDANWSYTPWKALYQQTKNVLRYTTMIEIMAPTFEMDYFQNFIRPSLYNAHVGWGLDFVWPFLLNYPRDKIAVIDQVCMFHPPSRPNKADSVYNADAPYRKKEEETRRFAEYGYFESEIEKRGFYHMAVEVVGVVPKPVPKESLMESTNRMIQSRLGPMYPLVLILQSSIIVLGFLLMIRTKIRSRWRQVQLSHQGRYSQGAPGKGEDVNGKDKQPSAIQVSAGMTDGV